MSDSDDVYAVCPHCGGIARNSWSTSEKDDWKRSHLTYKDCKK